MKRYLKKISALILTVIMVLSMCTVALAADSIIGNSDDRGKITVNGIEEKVTVTAYSIAPATYDSNGNFSGYDNIYGIGNLEKPTQDEIAKIWDGKNADGKTAATTALKKEKDVISDGESAVLTDMPVGMYLISVTGSETTIYNFAIASVYYANESGSQNTLEDGNLTISNSEVWVKKSDKPKLTKTASKPSAAIGEDVEYTVSIDPVPNYAGSHPKLNIVDILDKGLTLKENTITVVVKGAGEEGKDLPLTNTQYTLNTTKNDAGKTVLTIDFVVNGVYKLNDYSGKEVVVSYTATVNENAALNEVANVNDATLNYTRDSKTTGNDGSDNGKTYTYTFDIDGAFEGSITNIATTHIINKLGEEVETINNVEVKKVLEGADFTLYKDEACTEAFGTATSTSDGQIHFTGLKGNTTYYLKETKAPSGYSVNTHVFEVYIDATYDETSGKLLNWTPEIDGTEIATFTVSANGTATRAEKIEKEADSPDVGFNIRNTKLSSLPSTGGIGTYLFTIIGVVIMAAAAGLFFVKRRRDVE